MKKIIPVIIILISACFLTLTYFNKPFDNSEITLTSHNNNHVENYAKENNFQYQNISDSEFANLINENEEEFTYNINNNKVEITGYQSDNKQIIIPETIENYPVTTITMNLDKTPEKIYMPETITDINSVININLNNDFYLTIIIEVFALILTIIMILMLNKKKNQDKTVYLTFLYILSFIYLLALNVVAYLNVNNLLILSIIITIIYLILYIPIYFAKSKLKEYDTKIQNTNNFINNALELAKEINDPELIETIKYSDPITNSQTKEIEEEIINILNDVIKNKETKNNEKIVNLIKERNDICKKTKGN